MTSERQYILLADDDEAIITALSYTLARDGRTVILCSDVDAAELVLARYPITHLVTDVQFTGSFGFEGLHFLTRVRAQAPTSRIVLMTGDASPALCLAASHHGASVLAKPFATADLEKAFGTTAIPEDAEPYEIIRVPSMEEILHGDGLSVAFQPIVRLTRNGSSAFAYEALTRVTGPSFFDGPVMLFDYAERRRKLPELNILMMTQAIEQAASLPEDSLIFINLDPLTFNQPQLIPSLYRAAIGANVLFSRIVLEVTERSRFSAEAAGTLFEQLRAVGIRFALDDHGSAYSHLGHIDQIRPSFIKISNEFGTGFEDDETKERIVRNTVALARDFGCEPILEGIETSVTAQAAIDAGVPLGQGFHFSHARAAAYWTEPKKQAVVRAIWAA